MTSDEEATGVAPDGSPVEVYVMLPPLGEAEIVHGVIPEGAHVLELGCGAGRITHRLIELGHPVTAVDNSVEMLSHVRGAEVALADIETLELERQFEAVLLASNLVNTVDDEQRRAFLATCARHLAPSGAVLIQRYSPDWGPSKDVDEQIGSVRLRLHDGRSGTR